MITLGMAIPSPGLDLSPYADRPADLMLELGPSLFELGLQPLLTVLVLIEFVRLAAPRSFEPVGRLTEAGGMPLPAIAGLVALGLATLDALAYYRGFDEIAALDGGRLSTLAGVATLVAGAALLIWLTGRVQLAGLERSGLWVVYALLAVGIVPYDLRNAIEAAQAGVFPLSALLLVLLATAPIVAAIVFTRLTMMRSLARSGCDPFVWSPVLLWPPVITAWTVGVAVNGLDRVGYFSGMPTIWNSLATVVTVMTAVLLPAILFLYARAIARRDPSAARWRGKRAILAGLALLQTAICIAALGFWTALPLSTQGPELLVIVVVCHSLWLEMPASAARRRTSFRSLGRTRRSTR